MLLSARVRAKCLPPQARRTSPPAAMLSISIPPPLALRDPAPAAMALPVKTTALPDTPVAHSKKSPPPLPLQTHRRTTWSHRQCPLAPPVSEFQPPKTPRSLLPTPTTTPAPAATSSAAAGAPPPLHPPPASIEYDGHSCWPRFYRHRPVTAPGSILLPLLKYRVRIFQCVPRVIIPGQHLSARVNFNMSDSKISFVLATSRVKYPQGEGDRRCPHGT